MDCNSYETRFGTREIQTMSQRSNDNQLHGITSILVNKILIRERYLNKLRKEPNADFFTINTLLDSIRLVSIDVVVAIIAWRKKKKQEDSSNVIEPGCNLSFFWKGFNYLLKISSDLDFLNSNVRFVHWLGFSLIHNPFAISLSMENDPVTTGEIG